MINIICTICHESIAQKAEGGSGDDLVIIGMTCGHIFHFPCIKRWFIRSGSDDGSVGPCPCCQTEISLHHGLRLFPTSDEAVEEKDCRCRQCQVLTKLVQEEMEAAESEDFRKLRCENARKTAELQKLQKQLEDEKNLNMSLVLVRTVGMGQRTERHEKLRKDIREKGEDMLEDIRQKGKDMLLDFRQKGDDMLGNIRQKGDELQDILQKGREFHQEIRNSGDGNGTVTVDALRGRSGPGDGLLEVLTLGQGLLDNFRRTEDTLRNDIQRNGDTLRNDFQRTGDTFRNNVWRTRDALNMTKPQTCTIL